jgi:hypothetical protein
VQRESRRSSRKPEKIRAPDPYRTRRSSPRSKFGAENKERRGRTRRSRHAGQRLVHGQMHVGVARDALDDRQAPCRTAWPSAMPTSSTVWWMSMCRSPLQDDAQIDQSVAGDLIQHVIVKADSGRNFGLSRTVEIDGDGDVRFFRAAGDRGAAHGFGSGEGRATEASSKSPAGWPALPRHLQARRPPHRWGEARRANARPAGSRGIHVAAPP